MDTIKCLVETHINMGKLEKEVKKCRRNLIKEYKNKNSSVYILKISYTGFAEELKKETAKFDKLLQDLDTINIDDINDECSEIMENMDACSESSTGSERELQEILYRTSIPMTENLSVDGSQIKIEREEKKEMPEKEPIKPVKPEEEKKEIPAKEPVKPVSSGNVKKMASIGTKNTKSTNSNDGNTVINKINHKHVTIKCNPGKVMNKNGYKYQGKGFEVYTGSKIYSSTLLFCEEACDNNKKELTKYLIKNGDFKKEMIEEIMFKRSLYGGYALIRVRGPLKFINQKIDTLNDREHYNIIKLFKRSQYVSHVEKARHVLYVNNFDILGRGCHKSLTNLFLEFGELVKDIKMGVDRLGDCYALVHFRNIKDARKCYESKEIKFGGKVLNISYSRF